MYLGRRVSVIYNLMAKHRQNPVWSDGKAYLHGWDHRLIYRHIMQRYRCEQAERDRAFGL